MLPLLYIDPGTGSILFSIVIGLITTLYFLTKTAIIRLKVLIYKDKTKVNETKTDFVFTLRANNTGMYLLLYVMNLKRIR